MAKRAKGKSLWDEAMEHWKANQGLVLQEGSYRLVYNRLEDIDWNTGKIINDDSAQGQSFRQRLMVLLSKAYTILSISSLNGPSAYRGRTLLIRACPKSR